MDSKTLHALLHDVSCGSPSSVDVVRGFSNAEDAALVKFASDLKTILLTIDYFTPIVDDPIAWGEIAAANALSDIYVSGGSPLAALSVAAWPEGIDVAPLTAALGAASRALALAGAPLVGGHSIFNAAPLLGFAVVGEQSAGQLSNSSGEEGDLLVLTKSLGTGVISTAHKYGAVDEDVLNRAISSMRSSNRVAASVASQLGVVCATDVSGFGLVGHVHELAKASGLAAEIYLDAIPILGGALALFAQFETSGGRRNRTSARTYTDWNDGEIGHIEPVLFDPQTSGGMLVACAPAVAGALLNGLAEVGVAAAQIGKLSRKAQPGMVTATVGERR